MAVYPAAEPRSFEHHVLDFLAYLEFERGLSRNTLEAYRSDLLQFGAFLRRRGADVLTAPHGGLAAFLSDLATGAPDLPALVLPPPAPRGRRAPRPDRRPARAAQGPEAAAGAEPRRGRPAAVGAAR